MQIEELQMAEQNESFRKALLATHDAVITHSIGKTRDADTVLTQREFCARLLKNPRTVASSFDSSKFQELTFGVQL